MTSLLHPLFLAGLGGMALPVLIHFLTRPRPRRIAFPTLHLLMEAGSGRQALDRLRTFFLLLCRCLALGALAVLFAGPYRHHGSPDTPADAQGHVILLDASLSMRAAPAGVPLFTHARARAADLLRDFDPGTHAAVILVGATPRPVLPALSTNLPSLHETLAEAQPTYEEADAPAAVALAARFLGETGGRVLILSDFQRTNWGHVDFDAHPGIRFVLHPVHDDPVPNLGVTGVSWTPLEPTAGERVDLAATVFNATPLERTARLRLDLEGVGQEAEVLLAPYASGQAAFSFSLPQSGRHTGHVRLLEGDALPEDDIRHIQFTARESLSALLLTDTPRRGNARFLEAALAPHTTGIRLTARHASDVDRTLLRETDLFFLIAPATLPGEFPDLLVSRVREGASLLVFLDPSAEGAVETPPVALLDTALAKEGDSFPVAVGDVPLHPHGAGAAFQSLASVDTTHPMLRIFDSPDEGEFSGILYRRHHMTIPRPGRETELLAIHADGSAALTYTSFGNGTAILVNIPLDPQESNLAGSPLFPALVHEMLRTLRHRQPDAEPTLGEAFTFPVPAPASGDAPSLRAPDGTRIPLEVLARGHRWLLSAPPLPRPGMYHILDGDTPMGVIPLNVSPRETDTRPVHLESILDSPTPVSVVTGDGDLLRAGQPRTLRPWLLLVVVCAVMVELLLLACWPKRSERRRA